MNASIARCRQVRQRRGRRENPQHQQPLANEAPIDVRRPRRSARRPVRRNSDCADCAPRRKYDSQEVVKKVRNVDHSRVINTRTVVPVRTRVKETNHLVIHKNETRHDRRGPAQPHHRRKRNALRPAHPGRDHGRIHHAQLPRRGAAGHHHGPGDAAPAERLLSAAGTTAATDPAVRRSAFADNPAQASSIGGYAGGRNEWSLPARKS